MTNDEMTALLEETLSLQRENARVRNEPQPVAKLRKPTDPSHLARLDFHLARNGLKLPPSLRRFLSITDGIEAYMQLDDLSIRSAAEIEDGFNGRTPGLYADPSAWADFAPLCNFVFGAGDTSAFIAFDSDTVGDDDEMSVVMVSEDGGRQEFGTFEEFLQSQLAYQKGILLAHQADRAALADD